MALSLGSPPPDVIRRRFLGARTFLCGKRSGHPADCEAQ